MKKLDRTGVHDSKQFSVEVMALTVLHHPNLLNLVGYCADGEQRLLVYEYTPNHSLQDNLFGRYFEKVYNIDTFRSYSV